MAASAASAAASTARPAALDALERKDWPALLVHAGQMRAAQPGDANGWMLEVTALRGLGRRTEFLALLHEALGRFADHPRLMAMAAAARGTPTGGQAAAVGPASGAVAAIEAAMARRDWPAAARLSDRMRVVLPDEPAGYLLGSRVMREQKRVKRADQISLAGCERFPDDVGLLAERAQTLQRLKRLDEVVVCYARLRQLTPDSAGYYAREAYTLAMLQRFDQAEAVLQEGFARLGPDVELLVQHALLATKGEDLARARARWEEVRKVAPNDARLRFFSGNLTLAEQLEALEEAPDEEEVETDAGALSDAEVLKKFEGLGGNCEFGLVQRVAGIEPLGLLRFAGITTDELIGLLGCEMEGVGGEAHTAIALNGVQEYMLEDTRYFRSHTFIRFDDADEVALLAKLRRRTVFLRDKLMADLRKGGKVFVFRPADGVLSDEAIAALHAGVRAIGPGVLLCLRNAVAGEGAAVEERGDGLFVATLPGHTTPLTMGFIEAERFGVWLLVCREVLALLG